MAGELEVGADFHFAVHNAAGMVSVQAGISVTEALIRLRAFAFSQTACWLTWPRTSSTAGSGSNEPACAGARPGRYYDGCRGPAPSGAGCRDGPPDAQEGEVDMTREADVVRSLVEMADTLVDDYDVVDLLTGLADRCVNLLGVSAAGVMLASPQGSLGLVASSSEAMRLLELFELQAQEGPCLDAFRTGQPVGHEDLRAGSGRWPSFSAAALQGRLPARRSPCRCGCARRPSAR